MRVYGIGRIAKKPELQNVGDNQIVKTTIAWNDYRKNGHFHNIVAWNKVAQRLVNVNKGDRIMIDGTLSNNNYENKEGVTVYQNIITLSAFEYIEKKQSQSVVEPQHERPVEDDTTDLLPF